mgnify:CR=1 FL=1
MQYIHGNGEIDCCEDVHVGIQLLVTFSSDHVSVILSEIGLNKCV